MPKRKPQDSVRGQRIPHILASAQPALLRTRLPDNQHRANVAYYSVASVGGSWSPQGGSVSGFGYGETYTPTAIVWIYKSRGKALIFEKRGLFFDEQHTLIMVWRLVGWQNLKPDEHSVAPPAKWSVISDRQLSAGTNRFHRKALCLAGFRVPAGKPASQSAGETLP